MRITRLQTGYVEPPGYGPAARFPARDTGHSEPDALLCDCRVGPIDSLQIVPLEVVYSNVTRYDTSEGKADIDDTKKRLMLKQHPDLKCKCSLETSKLK